VSSLLPPGPFPPLASGEGEGERVDLAVRLQREFFQEAWLAGEGRRRLERRLALAVDLCRWPRAADLLQAWLDSWPLAQLVEPALAAWQARPAAGPLAQLQRVSELVRLAWGWRALPGTPWCLPAPGWVRQQAPEALEIQARSQGDGALELGADLSLPVRGVAALPAGLGLVRGEELVSRRAQLCRALAQGRLQAVRVQPPIPELPEAGLALGELRLEGQRQASYERWGEAGLRVRGEASWDESLESHAAGQAGAVLRATCEGRFLPGPPGRLRQGDVQRVGYLLWRASLRPVAVHPVAVVVLQALDGVKDPAALAQQLGAPPERLRELLAELLALGAATAA